MAALRERSFSSQLVLSLSVFLHRRYESERQIDVLYSLGFAASYVRVLLEIHKTPQSENSIDNLRYIQFIKSTKLNKPVQLFNIPPTSAAVHQHISRVYYQVQTWLGNHLKPQEWGSILRNEFLEPITTILPPTPDELLKSIFCNCKNGCDSRCGCKKLGCNVLQLVTSIIGQACFNASRYESETLILSPGTREVYGLNIMSKQMVHRWCRQFSEGRQSALDEVRSG
ncbi:uncharacterized protein TNIN_379671 [Trichonephila inaurata madagascariensis]|uniref:Uncharacterized protein n=1 Tax=Trichonephila inaurata madagascariensis TaxID=2747483 RepID=A0A8X6XDD4_9ARAC|nr:uncharacterized protein TNIN_379671 [Trichonephila inaurata madagascariensis]